jgi:hypothetical protein
MNHHEPQPGDDAAEREWQAQERAMRRERQGEDATLGDARERRYRLLDRVLREPPAAELPADFAASVAREARVLDARADARDRRFERRLVAAMWSVLAVVTAGVLGLYGRQLSATVSIGAAQGSWLLLAAACVVATGLCQGFLRRRGAR